MIIVAIALVAILLAILWPAAMRATLRGLVALLLAILAVGCFIVAGVLVHGAVGLGPMIAVGLAIACGGVVVAITRMRPAGPA